MKKIYSLVLLATTLLFSTNAMAQNVCKIVRGGADFASYDNLKTAFHAAQDGDRIVMNENLPNHTYTLTDSIHIYTTDSITLDLNGDSILSNQTYMLCLIKGKLRITGVGRIRSTHTGLKNETYSSTGKKASKGYPVWVAGSADPAAVNHTHLVVDEHVELIGNEVGIYTYVVGTGGDIKTSMGYAQSYWTKTENNSKHIHDFGGTIGYNKQYGCIYGVRVDVKGKVFGKVYGMNITGLITATEGNVGEYHIYPTAVIESGGVEPYQIGIYSAGYAKWIIEGTASGSTGVYVKSGDVQIQGAAHIESTATSYREAEARGAGVVSSGSALLIESNKSYIGEISVNIEGGTFEATAGYAIEETLTNAPENEVHNIEISAGTFSGGTEGLISTTDEVKQEIIDNGSITGGVFDDNEILDYLPAVQGYIEYVENATDKYQVVNLPVGETVKPDPETAPDNSYVKMEGTTSFTVENGETRTFSALMLTSDDNVVTVKDGGKLVVTEAATIIGNAKIIVEAGGQFIIEGAQGLVANSVDQLILQSNASGSAVFAFNPDVTANINPAATVQMYSKAHKTGNIWHTQHVAIPTVAAPAITFPTGGTTYAYTWVNGAWKNVQSLAEFDTPFRGYAFNFSGASAAGVYTYKGNIVGNGNGALEFASAEWNVMGNSYNSPIDARQMLLDLNAELGDEVEGTVWIYLSAQDRHESATASLIEDGDADFEHIAPMQGFIMRRSGTSPVTGSINYRNSVWNNTHKNNIEILAPARRTASNVAKATVVINSNNSKDKVVLREASQYSDVFDNGYDASKFMDENVFNFYGNTGEKDLCQIATDDLNGKKLSLQAATESVYTMSFEKVNNFKYVIRDNQNNTIIPVVEGQTYSFNVVPGTIAADRFELVSVRNMPTALDEVSAAHAAKGIYTVLGQYLGASDELDKLPKGVYVVDGVKIVK